MIPEQKLCSCLSDPLRDRFEQDRIRRSQGDRWRRLGRGCRYGRFCCSNLVRLQQLMDDLINLELACRAVPVKFGESDWTFRQHLPHSASNRCEKFAAVPLLHDQFPKRFSNDTKFVNRSSTLVTGLPALFASSPPIKPGPEFPNRESNLGQILRWVIHLF